MSGLHILGLLEHRDFSFLKQKSTDQDDDDGADDHNASGSDCIRYG